MDFAHIYPPFTGCHGLITVLLVQSRCDSIAHRVWFTPSVGVIDKKTKQKENQ